MSAEYALNLPIAEDLVLPGQFDGIGGRFLWQRNVICAMIEQAVSDCRSARNDEEWEDAAAWITGQDGSSITEPWDFESVCEVVQTDPDAVREELRRGGFLPRAGAKLSRSGIRKVKRRRRSRVR